MTNKPSIQFIDLLEDVLRKLRPGLLPLMGKVQTGALSDDERRMLMEVVTSEFCATGLGPGDEPNGRGLLLESLLDNLNRPSKMSDTRGR